MDTELARLATAHGVATWYENDQHQRIEVDDDVVVAVLAALGVDAAGPAAVRHALRAVDAAAQRHALPKTISHRVGERRELPGPAVLRCEDGTERGLPDGLPPDLPLGYHRIALDRDEITLVVAPPRLTPPPHAWGWSLQLYALRSAGSWGMGDLGDLRDFAQWAGDELGAGLVLCNPLHAVTPMHPVSASPYSPSSRRFTNPLYLRVTDTAAYVRADAETRRGIDELRPPESSLVDYDEVWSAKSKALDLLWQQEGRAGDPDAIPGLWDFATFCALAEFHGPDWRRWPAAMRHPEAEDVAAARVALRSRIRFHAWLQQQCAVQLAVARHAARAAGMSLGIVHDLAVGVDPAGADAWAWQDVLTSDVTIGAPPDAFSQHGQNWQLLPWRPDRLAEVGYQPLRDLLRATFLHAGGIRLDHVMGLWRMWWIPAGEPPSRGTYVQYDAEAMLAVLALEAERAQAVVIGEDLGTVEPAVRNRLREQQVLSTAVLWFQRDEEEPDRPLLPPKRWPKLAAASITTHDLPTAAGFLWGEHVRTRAELGLLDDPVAEATRAEFERAELVELLRREGLLDGEVRTEDLVAAMHGLLARTPCRLLIASPVDVLGETRQPNVPGTVHQYPNWRLPLPATLEELRRHPAMRRTGALFSAWLSQHSQ
ncbi:4-alpha-glucanotransferase [Streptoalloteichus hindustanus]|uniref:4-alpha-glucanotransferase n=1 Tax=Streptoalloteichus hindustanus TaxID=2017 RepID=A0A1M4Z642_STRHI|nr:4-alpha-glucanotransferase [Streptoalloteichus hindustanus]SHF13252.1 4-alpha-glucanotransferase [Streptoalloteichus hindustanus]